MPNRIIREGILTSERVNALDWEQEIFYRRLHSVVDDYGRFTAHPALLRAALYPLKLETVREANVQRLLASVEAARLVRLYEVEGKRFLEVLDFKQQVRAKDSKFPQPPAIRAADATQMPSRQPATAHSVGVGVVDGDDPPNPQPQTAGGGVDGGLSKEELWKRICACVGRPPEKAKSGLEMQALHELAAVTDAEMKLVERYVERCRADPAKYTKPKALAHTLLTEFWSEVGKARMAFGKIEPARKPVLELPADWAAFIASFSLDPEIKAEVEAWKTWQDVDRKHSDLRAEYHKWKAQK